MKKVKIIGLELKKSMGILKAHALKFDENNKLIVFKGEVGAGKTTEQKALQLATQGSKTLIDKKLYGEIDGEVQLLDGENNIWVGFRSDKSGSLEYTLYLKDNNGKVVKNPVIDGIKATPAKYLEALQTELTWKMDELTSENPVIQRDILLKLYSFQLQKQGVILDKKNPKFKESILGKIEQAENERNYRDAKRKELGGIAEDLKEKGFDINRPGTIPDSVDVDGIELQIKEIEKKKTIKEANAATDKERLLSEIKAKGAEERNKILQENNRKQKVYDEAKTEFNGIVTKNKEKGDIQLDVEKLMKNLHQVGGISSAFYERNSEALANEVTLNFDSAINPIELELSDTSEDLKELLKKHEEAKNKDYTPDLSSFDSEIEKLQEQKTNGIAINKIVDAVDSWHAWSDSNSEVVRLKDDYYNLLAKVDTGVEGLQIVPDDEKLYLMYNGSYDPAYFNNSNKELRKLSSYSGTQKPMICLLVQNHLLSKKPKAMRYMYIDNVPMDNSTRGLIERMCEELDITVFLNITGDFDREGLKDGEILIENGGVFFNHRLSSEGVQISDGRRGIDDFIDPQKL